MTASQDFEAADVAEARAAMGDLKSALARFQAVDLESLPGPVVKEFVRDSHAARARMESVDLRLVRRLDQSDAWRSDGALTAGSWLRNQLNHTSGQVRDRMHVARMLTAMPKMSAALAEGETSYAQVRAVASAADKNWQRRTTLGDADELLAHYARRHNGWEMGQLVRRWAHTVDPEGVVRDEQEIYEQREVCTASTLHGAVDMRALLHPEGGAIVIAALDAGVAGSYREAVAAFGEDERKPWQRRADALVDICNHYLGTADLPDVGGVKPQVQVIVGLATLQALRGERDTEAGYLVGVGPISGEAARRMTCDASIVRIVLDPAGQPLDVGRSTRTISAALRTALERRDGACRFPACDRKSAQCDAHHIQHWGHGGESAPPNLVLLCRHHHRLLHEGGFGIHGSPADELHFTRPDGTILDDPLPVPRGSFLLRFDDP